MSRWRSWMQSLTEAFVAIELHGMGGEVCRQVWPCYELHLDQDRQAGGQLREVH